jgi:hypothetical protein
VGIPIRKNPIFERIGKSLTNGQVVGVCQSSNYRRGICIIGEERRVDGEILLLKISLNVYMIGDDLTVVPYEKPTPIG